MTSPTVLTLKIGGIDVDKTNGVVSWTSGMAINADGASNCYGPDGCGYTLDHLANAGSQAHGWWGIACDDNGQPFVQGPDDPHPGFYVSTTALVDRNFPAHDPKRYVDACSVPAITVPPELIAGFGVRTGDLAWVTHGNREWGAIVSDVGPHGKVGEASPALARALGLSGDARTGGTSLSVVSYRIFCGTAGKPAWPRGDVNALAMATKAVRDAG